MHVVPVTAEAFPMLFGQPLNPGQMQVDCPGMRRAPGDHKFVRCDKRVWVNRIQKDGPDHNKMFIACFKDRNDGCGYYGCVEEFDSCGAATKIKEGRWHQGNRGHSSTTPVPSRGILDMLPPKPSDEFLKLAVKNCTAMLVEYLGSDAEPVAEECVTKGLKRAMNGEQPEPKMTKTEPDQASPSPKEEN